MLSSWYGKVIKSNSRVSNLFCNVQIPLWVFGAVFGVHWYILLFKRKWHWLSLAVCILWLQWVHGDDGVLAYSSGQLWMHSWVGRLALGCLTGQSAWLCPQPTSLNPWLRSLTEDFKHLSHITSITWQRFLFPVLTLSKNLERLFIQQHFLHYNSIVL